ncbi:MAG: sulfatase [Anaerolineaceae bacterium]|nr:sulfatase [Anaerolineaceae bacterium]
MPNYPNILFIVLDTQRRDRLSIYGHHRETSPAIDQFAQDATLFERAIAPAQWTIPSHASMFTGLYPGTHQVTQGYSQISGMHPTLPEILQGAGYHTVGFCNNPLVGVLNNGLQRGFDQFYNYAGATVTRPFNQSGGLLRRTWRKYWRNFARPVQNRFAHSDWLFRASMNPLLVPLWTRFINYKGQTPRSIDDVIAYMKHHRAGGADAPLFTFLNLMGTHLPYRPPQDYLDRVSPDLRHNRHVYQFMRRFNAEASRWASPTDPPLADWERQALNDFYDAEILHQDEQLARLFHYLKTAGVLDDTIVIITADHGEAHGDHNYVGHSFVVYQELVHVPLIIRDPDGRFPAGKRVQTNVSTRRIFHTALDMADIQPPLDEADPNADVKNLSLVRATNGRPDPEAGIAFSEAFPPSTFLSVLEHRNPPVIEQMKLRMVRRGVYEGVHKLAMVHDQVEGLFDTQKDPTEIRDIAAAQPDLTQQLQSRLAQFVQTSAAQNGGNNGFGEMDQSVEDNLRALGYIE